MTPTFLKVVDCACVETVHLLRIALFPADTIDRIMNPARCHDAPSGRMPRPTFFVWRWHRTALQEALLLVGGSGPPACRSSWWALAAVC